MSPGRGRRRRAEELRRPVHARSPRGAAVCVRSARRPQAPLWTPPEARGLHLRAASLLGLGTSGTEGAEGARLPAPPQRSGRTGHGRLQGGITTPARRPGSRPPPGSGGGAGGCEESRNLRKGGDRGRGTSSCAFETALLVLDGPRAAVLSNATSGSF